MKPIFFLLLLGVLASCGRDADDKPSKETISRDSIAISNKVSDVVAIGKVRPDSGMTDLSSTSGGMVIAKYINEGDTVKENQVLVKLKDVDQRDQLANLHARIETQKERIRSDELELDQYNIKIADKEKTLTTSLTLAEDQGNRKKIL